MLYEIKRLCFFFSFSFLSFFLQLLLLLFCADSNRIIGNYIWVGWMVLRERVDWYWHNVQQSWLMSKNIQQWTKVISNSNVLHIFNDWGVSFIIYRIRLYNRCIFSFFFFFVCEREKLPMRYQHCCITIISVEWMKKKKTE